MLCGETGAPTTGASLTLVTVRLKVVLTLLLVVSVAVTLMLRLPTSALPGVPEKVPVAALKLSQAGSAEPSASSALKVNESPSGSVKVPTGTLKFRPPFCTMLCAGIGVETTGGLPTAMVRLEVAVLVASSLTATEMVRVPPVGEAATLTYTMARSTVWNASTDAPPVSVSVCPLLVTVIPAACAARRADGDRVSDSLPMSCTPLSARVMLQIRVSPSVWVMVASESAIATPLLSPLETPAE